MLPVRLHAYFDVLEKDSSSLTGLKKRLSERLNEKQLRALATFLVSVAAATGGIVNSEVEALKKTFKTLGLKAGELDAILDKYKYDQAELVHFLISILKVFIYFQKSSLWYSPLD